jgi:general stress protein YciG
MKPGCWDATAAGSITTGTAGPFSLPEEWVLPTLFSPELLFAQSEQHRSCFTEGITTMTETSKRGFAGMDPEKQRMIASKGGKAAHAKGTAHHFTPEEARVAGRKGGMAAHAKGTAHEFTPEEAREAGRKGGQRSQARTGTNRSPEPERPLEATAAPPPAAPAPMPHMQHPEPGPQA